MITAKLDNMVNKYNKAYHITINMKSINVKLSTYTDLDVDNKDKYPKVKVGDHIKISRNK